MDFAMTDRARDYLGRLNDFGETHVEPAEPVYLEHRAAFARSGDPHGVPPVVRRFKVRARAAGL